MASAANHEAYGNPAWGSAPPGASPWGNTGSQGPGWQGPGWQGQGWNGPGWNGPGWYRPTVLQQIGISRPLGAVLTILGFIFFWPIGLIVLIAMLWSGRMGCWGRRRWAAYQSGQPGSGQPGDDRGPAGPWSAWRGWSGWCNANTGRAAPGSGNRAFDEYRAETLRRLEDEQKEFGAFLERLRFAKDKAEFDEFMSERRQRPTPPQAPPEQPAAG
jgi:hypothetical protein